MTGANNSLERLPCNPLLTGKPKVHLLRARADIYGKEEEVAPLQISLLVDTGATYTIVPVEVLNNLGYDIRNPPGYCNNMVTGQGRIKQLPIVLVSSLYCLGQRISDFPVLAYTLPDNPYWDGLLGMDFLTRFRAVLLLERAGTGKKDEIRCR